MSDDQPVRRATLAGRVDAAIARLRAIDDEVGPTTAGDEFRPAAVRAVVDAGLGRAVLPLADGGDGAGAVELVGLLAAIAATDGSTALGLAMHSHVLAGLIEWAGLELEVRGDLVVAVRDAGALVNSAATEEETGSPARGGLVRTTAERDGDGDGWRLSGEKTWTTWLPALRFALVSARLHDPASDDAGPPRVGSFLVDLATAGVERLAGFAALGMRGSASGRLRLDGVAVPAERLLFVRVPGEPDPRGPSPAGWFGLAIAATYLGIGEGARRDVARWALSRRPGDGTTAVADLPTVQVRLGRLDASLRAARIVLLDTARRWDELEPAARGPVAADVALAKLVATRAAADATDEALRIAGGAGFLAGRLERAFRDARAGLINPPLEDVALQGFARAVLARERSGGTD